MELVPNLQLLFRRDSSGLASIYSSFLSFLPLSLIRSVSHHDVCRDELSGRRCKNDEMSMKIYKTRSVIKEEEKKKKRQENLLCAQANASSYIIVIMLYQLTTFYPQQVFSYLLGDVS